MMQSTMTRTQPLGLGVRIASGARPCRSRAPRTVMMAERPRQDDNPADKAAAIVEDKLEGFVEATKENSGLNKSIIGQQPGNKTPQKGSIVDESGKAGEVMSPGGLIPEIANGRLAMLGMLAAFGSELATGKPVAQQIQVAPALIAGTFILIIIASVIPVISMVAFALLNIVEGWKAGPGLVPWGGGGGAGL